MTAIRAADASDAEAVAGLLAELGYPVAPAGVAKRLAEFADSDSADVLLAVVDHEVVGLVGLTMTPLLAEDGFLGRITALVVGEGHRRKGLGRMLMAEAERGRVAPDAPRLMSPAASVPSGRRRIGFYPSLGYVDAGAGLSWRPRHRSGR